MKTKTRWTVLAAGCCLAVAGLALFLTPCHAGDDTFHVSGGKLMRDDDVFTIKAIQVPEVSASGGPFDVAIASTARIGESGGNTICFDLAGFSADGAKIDPIGPATVRAFAERTKDQWMGLLVRVLGAGPASPEARKRAVKTAAKALHDEGRAIYWIDGPDAGKLAKIFHRYAKNLVVAAPENGQLTVVDHVPDKNPGGTTLVAGVLPDPALGSDIHFVLPSGDATYAMLDKALMTDVEKAPWTPDNSVLSEADRKDGFIALFNGKNLDGWWVRGDDPTGFFVSEEGCIEWLHKGAGALVSHDRYGNFVLRYEWKILTGGNSGVWCRAPRAGRASKLGFEAQIMGDSDVAEPDKSNTGSIYDVLPPIAMPAKPEGQWNQEEVVCDGPHVTCTINGVVTEDVNFDDHDELRPRLRKGFICLTDHDSYVAFRNIRIKPF